MGIGVKVRVWGKYALFSRPEMKVERCSYDVMTPSAARGILEAVYWHPGMRWVIDKIHVVNPVRFTSVRRIVFKHSKELGDCPAYKLFDAVEIKKKEEVEYPRKYQDYIVEVHKEQIPETVEVKRMV